MREMSARLELAANAVANIDDFKNCRIGDRIQVWAAGEAADASLTCQVGQDFFGRGRTSIESVANAGPLDNQNLFADCEVKKPGDLVVTNTSAVVVQVKIRKVSVR